jgi:hypothetical protein
MEIRNKGMTNTRRERKLDEGRDRKGMEKAQKMYKIKIRT